MFSVVIIKIGSCSIEITGCMREETTGTDFLSLITRTGNGKTAIPIVCIGPIGESPKLLIFQILISRRVGRW